MALTHLDKSVSRTHSSLDESVAFARRLYQRVSWRDARSYHAIRMYIAGLGLAVRAARRDPEKINSACKRAGIKGQRLEVRVARLVAGSRVVGRSDQIARWANAAAYLALPANGDVPPETFRQAIRYVSRRGGVRRLSNLYAGARRGQREQPDDEVGIYYRRDGAEGTEEWYTPRYIFEALQVQFDLDPASPGAKAVPWIPARHHYTSNGLDRDWFGVVWLNPPYGRAVLPLWLEKFARHGNGIALVPERTSTRWWQELVGCADLILCVNTKIPFANGSGEKASAFPIGSTLVAMGEAGVRGLIAAHRNGLGLLLKPMPLADDMAAAAD